MSETAEEVIKKTTQKLEEIASIENGWFILQKFKVLDNTEFVIRCRFEGKTLKKFIYEIDASGGSLPYKKKLSILLGQKALRYKFSSEETVINKVIDKNEIMKNMIELTYMIREGNNLFKGCSLHSVYIMKRSFGITFFNGNYTGRPPGSEIHFSNNDSPVRFSYSEITKLGEAMEEYKKLLSERNA